MSTLNLFPARIEIGQFRGADGVDVKVYQSPEFARALSALLQRVGGVNGLSTTDLAMLVMDVLARPLPASEPGVAFLEPQLVGAAPEFVNLSQQVESLALSQPLDISATVADLVRQVNELQSQVAMLSAPAAPSPPFYGAEEWVIAYSSPSAVSVDWERPGEIGAQVPNSGAFTTLTASAAVTLSPANANVIIAPTGTGLATISPATTGAMDNMTLGATTPKSVKGTTIDGTVLTTTGAFSLFNGLLRSSGTTGLQFDGASTAANAEAFFENTDSVFILHASSSGAVVKTLDFCATGAATVHFRVANTGTTTTGTHTVSGGFGCNGKAAQTAAASGAAVAATGATNVAPFGYTTAAQADRIVALVNTMQAALIADGILS